MKEVLVLWGKRCGGRGFWLSSFFILRLNSNVMINKKLEEATNAQIQAEMYSANLYLSMSAYFKSIGLDGFAHWMYVQYQEEMFHAMKFFKYLFSRGGKAEIREMEKPQTKFDSPLAVFEKALAHEELVTSLINKLYEISLEEKDYAFQTFIQWYIDEQVEEEESAQGIIDKIKLAGEGGIYWVDKELGTRTFAPSNPADGEV